MIASSRLDQRLTVAWRRATLIVGRSNRTCHRPASTWATSTGSRAAADIRDICIMSMSGAHRRPGFSASGVRPPR